MLTQRKKMDVLANNIANSTIIGFKEDNLLSRSLGICSFQGLMTQYC